VVDAFRAGVARFREVYDVPIPEEAAKLGFHHFAAVQEALDAALAQKGSGARVTFLTHAPDMLPRITPGSASPLP